MSEFHEAVWRDALQAKGKDWVARKLSYPGMANDPVLDVVFAEPLPTREFCQRWYVEEHNKMFALSKGMIVAVLLVVLFAGSLVRAISSMQATLTRDTTISGATVRPE